MTVRRDLSPAQQVKTLAHELVHILLHDQTDRGTLDWARAEVEAESVPYLVCTGLSIDSDDYSFPYLPLVPTRRRLVRGAAERADTTAQAILTDLDLIADRAA